MASIYKLGSRGVGVKLVQSALGQAGWPVIVDGIFGEITRDAVIEFQKAHGLTADGIVGPATLAYLIPDAGCAAIGLKKSRREIREIIIHCTATREGRDATVEEIRQDHIRNRGWSDIGYHYVIYRDGSIHEGRDIGKVGAHTTGYNTGSIGICYIGGLDKNGKIKDTRTYHQDNALYQLVKILLEMYPSVNEVKGHRDYSPDTNGDGVISKYEWIKGCPCFDVTEWMHQTALDEMLKR